MRCLNAAALLAQVRSRQLEWQQQLLLSEVSAGNECASRQLLKGINCWGSLTRKYTALVRLACWQLLCAGLLKVASDSNWLDFKPI
jgi:hypothetical protein